MWFPKGNTILFGVDRHLKVGIPHDVEFKVDHIGTNGKMRLVGKGYGDSVDYGNGAIWLFLKHQKGDE